MKKMILYCLSISVILFLSMIMLLLNKQYNARVKIKRLPSVELSSLDNTIVDLRELPNNMPLLICYFHPECEFCAMELQDIIAHKKEMKNIQLVLVSLAPNDEIKKMIKEYHLLDSLDHIIVTHDATGQFSDIFNIQAPPTWFLYDKDKHLKKIYKGTISVSEILKSLI